ncbi:hypothetical protein VNO77_23541 [Canavalia gladiata]|uniref:Uncharacterized protein n=1 Tax=Canavalia gladiata TaxID=3824 RepID=A0AAN9L7Z6_CANGL
MWEEDDELLEQLEMVMGSPKHAHPTQPFTGPARHPRSIFPLGKHPNTPPPLQPFSILNNTNTPSRVFNDDSEYDLRAIPGIAPYPPQQNNNETEIGNKRFKHSLIE